ncbi:hypothetical protein D3C80_1937510 [compost metagenome]
MTHALTTNLGTRYFNAAAIADYAFVTYPFVFTTMTFPVFRRSKNFLAEESFLLRF